MDIDVKQAVRALKDKDNIHEHGTTKVLTINAIYAGFIAEYLEQQERDAELGRDVDRGMQEFQPDTGCGWQYDSEKCQEHVKTCVLKYYCKVRSADHGHS